MNTNLQKIGELLAQCRKNKGLTQEEVGVMIGVQKAMVSKVENGLCVNFGTVNRIAEALGVEPIVALKSKKKADKNLIDYVMTVIVEFARRHDLTIREASNYIRRFKGIDFLTPPLFNSRFIRGTPDSHQFSPVAAIVCQNNGGTLR